MISGDYKVEGLLKALRGKRDHFGVTPRQRRRLHTEIVVWELRNRLGKVEQSDMTTICSGAILILTVRKSEAEAEKPEIFVSGSLAILVSVAAERYEDLLPRNKKTVERLGLTPGEWADCCEDKEAMERAVAILTGGTASVRASSAPLPPPPVSPASAIA